MINDVDFDSKDKSKRISGRQSSARTLCKIAILSAISFVLFLPFPPFRFSLGFMFPSFLEFHISELPAVLAGFSMGFIPGCAVVLVKQLLKVAFFGLTFGGIGDLADISISLAYVLVAALIYGKHKTRRAAAWSMVFSTLAVVVVALLINRFLLVPFYAKLLGWEALIGMMSALFPNITMDSFYAYYLPLSTLPFNVLRFGVMSVVTMLIYKKLSRILHW